MRTTTRAAAVLVAGACLAACGRAPGRNESPAAGPPPEPVAVEPVEEPARPVPDPVVEVPELDDETEGLDLRPFEGSGPTAEEQAASGTIGGSFVLPQPFPPRRACHLGLLRGRGRATQSAVVERLATLHDRELAAGGWAEAGTEPDVALTSLCVSAAFSVGDVWSDRRAACPAREGCRFLVSGWEARGNGVAPKDRPSHKPSGVRANALFVLAVSEWRASTWVVYALDEGPLALATLRSALREAYPDGVVVASDEQAIDSAWALLALHMARLAEFEIESGDVQRLVAALDRTPADAEVESFAASLAVARALATAFHRSGARRADVAEALRPALEFSVRSPEAFERPSDRMFLTSIAAMQAGAEVARDWNRRVLRPLAQRPATDDLRETALAAMCLSSYYRYSPAVAE